VTVLLFFFFWLYDLSVSLIISPGIGIRSQSMNPSNISSFCFLFIHHLVIIYKFFHGHKNDEQSCEKDFFHVSLVLIVLVDFSWYEYWHTCLSPCLRLTSICSFLWWSLFGTIQRSIHSSILSFIHSFILLFIRFAFFSKPSREFDDHGSTVIIVFHVDTYKLF
jgi:hypothetical protein